MNHIQNIDVVAGKKPPKKSVVWPNEDAVEEHGVVAEETEITVMKKRIQSVNFANGLATLLKLFSVALIARLYLQEEHRLQEELRYLPS